ncbi:ParB/RepB/Spo0J family partition protein [Nodularia spumigena CS-584]|jgi:ParB family transcriptional regulator, chromosome partitioning protein|uniref:ParB/RepB/Spo0J family partition protein n=1 Tax=Nodularia spumigena TaxID=70799 RepID=UPI0000EABA13|nr:ParB/RepB/Spo0J family partition protein [Nodularia spumigena]AHJ29352.1 Chromosome (plasmid) partitioning protein ParB [Nodularia spumigena CCY9414]EAW45290.1 ParB-like partition protein [Nodularia spumigena CCY9414]MDB9382942.1 ParB/RepB/Spo0J family partition protein [Nodularia spumigena CS-584]
MTTRKSPDLTNYFSGAKQSQQLSEAEAEIQRLKAEIEELRSQGSSELETQLQTLRAQLQSQSGIQSISLEKIQANPEQPRQTFLSESIESMSRSLVSDGQLEPIILIQREHLVIFDGERRWRSAKNLGWENLQAVIIPEPDALHRKALITSLHREDLNPLDKAEAIVRELAINTGLEPQDIPRILSTVVRRLNAQKRMNSVVGLITVTPEEQQQGLAVLDLDEREAAIFTVLLDLQLNPASIDANIFPMLSLAEDLKTAIRSSGLKGVHAIALQKLSAKNLGVPELEAEEIRINVTQKVLAEKLSVQKTRQLVTEAIASQSTDAEKIEKQVKPMTTATRSLYKVSGDALKKVEVSQLMEFQEVLRKKLAEIEEVIQEKAVNDNKV